MMFVDMAEEALLKGLIEDVRSLPSPVAESIDSTLPERWHIYNQAYNAMRRDVLELLQRYLDNVG